MSAEAAPSQAQAAPPAPPPPAAAPPPSADAPARPALPAPGENGRVYVDRAAITAWGASYGVRFDGDMLHVQQITRRIGHPEIVCVGG